MGTNQGLIRLLKGASRNLTASEIARGYLFITKDKIAQKTLGKNFSIIVRSEEIKNQNIDGSGRVLIGKSFTEKFKHREIKILLEHNKIIIN